MGKTNTVLSQSSRYSTYFGGTAGHFSYDVRTIYCRHPKFRELIQMKDNEVRISNVPPMFLQRDLRTFNLAELKTKFDVILVDPPWSEYSRRCPGAPQNATRETWTFDDLRRLNISSVAASRCFMFLWAGSCEGLQEVCRAGFIRCRTLSCVLCLLYFYKLSISPAKNAYMLARCAPFTTCKSWTYRRWWRRGVSYFCGLDRATEDVARV